MDEDRIEIELAVAAGTADATLFLLLTILRALVWTGTVTLPVIRGVLDGAESSLLAGDEAEARMDEEDNEALMRSRRSEWARRVILDAREDLEGWAARHPPGSPL